MALPKRMNDPTSETAGLMRWLLTYADMITLMLALFIILFSMSTINRTKVQQFARLVSQGFDNVWTENHPPNGGKGVREGAGDANVPTIQRELQRYVQTHKLQSRVEIHLDRRGLVITLLSDGSYYDSGSAEMRPQTLVVIDAVYQFLKKNQNLIRVEGNTDNVPIHTSAYPTNWELSTARAVNVVRYLVEHDGLDPTRVSAAGYGEFRPRRPNDTPAGRQQNRRVDIVLLNATRTSEEK
jgi:chemotaxis protein MotB